MGLFDDTRVKDLKSYIDELNDDYDLEDTFDFSIVEKFKDWRFVKFSKEYKRLDGDSSNFSMIAVAPSGKEFEVIGFHTYVNGYNFEYVREL